jgi:cytochrome P450
MTQASIQSPAPVFDGDLFTDDVLADPYASYATLRELGPAGRSLIATDGDRHSHLRKILAHNITPRAIRHLEAQIQTQADALIADLVARPT